MSPEQVRAARNWLGWTQQQLAERAHVGLSTIKSFEAGDRTPIANNVLAIRAALEAAGMKITDDAISGPLGTVEIDSTHGEPVKRQPHIPAKGRGKPLGAVGGGQRGRRNRH